MMTVNLHITYHQQAVTLFVSNTQLFLVIFLLEHGSLCKTDNIVPSKFCKMVGASCCLFCDSEFAVIATSRGPQLIWHLYAGIWFWWRRMLESVMTICVWKGTQVHTNGITARMPSGNTGACNSKMPVIAWGPLKKSSLLPRQVNTQDPHFYTSAVFI